MVPTRKKFFATDLSLLSVIMATVTAASNASPSPLTIGASQFWTGNDGMWSTFAIQVGSPAQVVQVIPSTVADDIWLMDGRYACPSGIPIANCATERGFLFNSNQSLSWVPNSDFSLLLDDNLGLDDSAAFGFDQVCLGYQGSGCTTVDHQVIGLTGSNKFYLGGMGLNPRPVNFTNYDNPQISLLQSMRNKNLIPSLSWTYTAGAHYRLNQALATLILGGMDTSLLATSAITIPFNQDISRDLSVYIEGISTNTSASSNHSLLDDGLYSMIDSTFPWIWLPQSSCTLFEQAFNLTWDSTYSLYLLNATQHTQLLQTNPSIAFSVSAHPGSPTVDITLPYSAFDVNASWPLVAEGTSSYYFPLKRASNSSQFTLGRAFLQEAVVTADYERSTFSLAPRNWDFYTQSNVVAIHPVGYSSSGSSLSAAAIAGITIAAVAITVLLCSALAYFCIRRRRQSRTHHAEMLASETSSTTDVEKFDEKRAPVVLSSEKSSACEADSNERFEASGEDAYVESGGFERPRTPLAELPAQNGVDRSWWSAVHAVRSGSFAEKGGEQGDVER